MRREVGIKSKKDQGLALRGPFRMHCKVINVTLFRNFLLILASGLGIKPKDLLDDFLLSEDQAKSRKEGRTWMTRILSPLSSLMNVI